MKEADTVVELTSQRLRITQTRLSPSGQEKVQFAIFDKFLFDEVVPEGSLVKFLPSKVRVFLFSEVYCYCALLAQYSAVLNFSAENGTDDAYNWLVR